MICTWEQLMKQNNLFVKILIYSCISLLIIFYGFYLYSKENYSNNKALAKQLIQKEYNAFFSYFEIKDTLYFNYNNLIIGDITNFIYMGKACALFDRISDSLFYIDLISKKYRSITTEDSLPGYHLNIMQMVAINENDFVISSDPYYHILFSEGKIRKVLKNINYRASHQFIARKNSIVIYHHPIPEELSLVEMNINTGKAITLFELNEVGKNLRNLLYRNDINGGFLYDEDAGFFIANAYENCIYRYNLTGKLTHIYQSNYKNFKKVEHDATQNTPEAILELWRQSKKRPFDMLYSIYFLNQKIILAAYVINKRLYIELFDKATGKIINDEDIAVPFPIKYCSDNLLFLEVQPPEIEKEGQIANPYLIKFLYRKKR